MSYTPRGRTDESSYDYTDHPASLAEKFDQDQLEAALQDGGLLKFDYEEYVPTEAIVEAIALLKTANGRYFQ